MEFVVTAFDVPFEAGPKLVQAQTFEDQRGYFRETYRSTAFAEAGIDDDFTQGNQSRSSAGVMRGLHYQTEPNQVVKLVSVAYGAIWDVAVDVRPDSPTFGRYASAFITDSNALAMYVPRGFAHGFVALAGPTVVSYLMAGEYSAENDAGLRWNDPDVGIEWPFVEGAMLISEKDQQLPFLKELA